MNNFSCTIHGLFIRMRSDVQGSGLGLSIAEWIVREHGGSIAISEGAEPTTVVLVRLPGNPKPQGNRTVAGGAATAWRGGGADAKP